MYIWHKIFLLEHMQYFLKWRIYTKTKDLLTFIIISYLILQK